LQVTGGTKKKLEKEQSNAAKSQGEVAKKSKSSDSEGSDDEEDEGVDDAEQGTLSFGKRKEIVAYGDDDDGDDSEDSDSDSDSDEEMTDAKPSSTAASAAASSSSSTSSSSSSTLDVVHLRNIAGNVARSKLFCSATAAASPSKTKPGDAWMEVVLTTNIEYKKIMMLALVENLVKEVLIFSTKSIKNTYVLPPARGLGDKALWRVQTDGVNFHAAWESVDVGVNPNTIASNDINAILETYGVEAARLSIVKEVLGVFGVYGINVDPRHLALIADYMTFEGKYRPMNRLGIGGSASPFLKMSFETSMNFLTAATTRGGLDNTDSPSARIVLGRIVGNGTGSCGVRMDYDMMHTED
jgi:DNA-directed RNA polymerase I subunit RPA1